MVKVNKKKNVNNNNVLKIESEHLRLAILLNNNLEFQYKWNLIYKYILIFIKFSTFIIFVLIKCTLFLLMYWMIVWGMFLYIYKYTNTTEDKLFGIKIAKRAWKSEDLMKSWSEHITIFHKEKNRYMLFNTYNCNFYSFVLSLIKEMRITRGILI